MTVNEFIDKLLELHNLNANIYIDITDSVYEYIADNLEFVVNGMGDVAIVAHIRDKIQI
jgi:hypothetical protein